MFNMNARLAIKQLRIVFIVMIPQFVPCAMILII